jgi:O-antigen/teichoic acid export membrane protein
MGSNIRLRSSGLVVFGSRIVSVGTGLAFLVMVTRWLNPGQFGLWEFIIDLVTFASYPAGLIAFWVTRDVARGKRIGRTAILSSLLLSVAGIGIYLLFTFATFSSVSTNFFPFMLAILLVPSSYWNLASNSVVAGYRPSAAAYSTLVSEVLKLVAAYPLLYIYRTGINGVILALLVSYLSQAAVATYVTRDASSEALRPSEVKRWLGAAWLPAINTLPYVVGIADTFVASLAFGTAIAGYYQAAFAVASIVGYSVYLSTALYPLLLSGGQQDLVAVTMDFSLLFGIPMAVGAAVLAPAILYLLAPKYVQAALALVILSFSLLLTTASGILDFTLLGTETADLNEEKRFGRYTRSNLLFVPAANLTYSVVYIAAMYTSLRIAAAGGYSVSSTVAAWALSQLLVTLALVVWKERRAKASARIFRKSSLLRYSAAALLMGLLLYLVSPLVLPAGLETVSFASRLFATVILGGATYSGALYTVDAAFRNLVRSFLGLF